MFLSNSGILDIIPSKLLILSLTTLLFNVLYILYVNNRYFLVLILE